MKKIFTSLLILTSFDVFGLTIDYEKLFEVLKDQPYNELCKAYEIGDIIQEDKGRSLPSDLWFLEKKGSILEKSTKILVTLPVQIMDDPQSYSILIKDDKDNESFIKLTQFKFTENDLRLGADVVQTASKSLYDIIGYEEIYEGESGIETHFVTMRALEEQITNLEMGHQYYQLNYNDQAQNEDMSDEDEIDEENHEGMGANLHEDDNIEDDEQGDGEEQGDMDNIEEVQHQEIPIPLHIQEHIQLLKTQLESLKSTWSSYLTSDFILENLGNAEILKNYSQQKNLTIMKKLGFF